MEQCDITHMPHFREMPPCDRDTVRHDLTGPQCTDSIKRRCIRESPYAVKKGA